MLKVRQLENIKSAINKIVVEGDMLTIKGFNYYERKKIWFKIALLLLGLFISGALFFYSKDAGIAACFVYFYVLILISFQTPWRVFIHYRDLVLIKNQNILLIGKHDYDINDIVFITITSYYLQNRVDRYDIILEFKRSKLVIPIEKRLMSSIKHYHEALLCAKMIRNFLNPSIFIQDKTEQQGSGLGKMIE